MEIRIRNTGEVMTEITFRTTFKDRLLPKQLTEEWLAAFAGGCDIVFEGPQATTTAPYEFSFRSGVEQIEGKWYTKYAVGPVFTDRPATETEPAQTAAEQLSAYKAQKDAEQAKSVRSSRNDKLKDCDWTQLADSTADKQAWATYRQALRDITSQTGFPWTIEWPEQP
jgi:hypothetical protein